MATISPNFLHIMVTIISISTPVTYTATVVEDLNNLQPPSDFNITITKNCLLNPSLRYCNNATPFDLHEIFKSTIVASHLCNISNNPNCIESFPKIDLHGQPKVAPLYLSFTFFWKYCPLTILSIDLSNNSLKGNFPSDVFYCSQIQALDLSYNNFSGDVPIQNFSYIENLTLLNLSYNHFSECKISDTHFFDRFNSSSFIHSGFFPDHKRFKIKAVLLLVGFPVFVIAMVVFLGWLCFSDFKPDFLRNKHKFRPSTLKAATDGFLKRNLVSKTSRASIYRGVLRNGSEVRVEVYLDNMSRENRTRFVENSKILVQLQHKNIVPLLGWCDSRRFKASVSEWIDGENVETWLINSAPTWNQRVKVVLGVVSGICYLHEEWPEVGCNLETRHILLCEDGEPLMTRFNIDEHHSSTKKAYKFGMFILEIVTNKRPMVDFDKNETNFVQWVKMHYPENLENVIDTRMKTTVDIVSEATEIIEFGLMCADLSSNRQPSWDKICDLLSNFSSKTKSSASPDHHRTPHRGHKHVHH